MQSRTTLITLAALIVVGTLLGATTESHAQSYTISASAGPGGTITPSGDVSVATGADQAFSVAANSCFLIQDVVVDGSSVGPVSSYTFSLVGADHTIQASFIQPTAALSSDVNPSVWAQAVTFTATVTPSTAIGTITFKDSLTTLGTVPLSGGTAQFVKSNLFAGNHTALTATLNVSGCPPTISPVYAQLVYRAPSSLSVTSDINPSGFGQTVKLTANATPGLTGRVTYYDSGNPIGTAAVNTLSGIATLNVNNLLPGSHSITISHPGDSHYAPSTSASPYIQLVIRPPSTTDLTVSPSPAACLQDVTLTASVSPSDAPGTVEFFDDATSLGSAELSSGVASITVSTLSVATHSLSATYPGSVVYTGSASSAQPLVVNKATPIVAVTSNHNPSTWAQTVTFTASITPATASGTVTFRDSLTVLGTVTVVGGRAQISKSNLFTGNHTQITAAYSGDGCVLEGTSAPYSQLVYRAQTTQIVNSDLNPAEFGQTVRFTATVVPVGATGRVSFFVDDNPIGTAALNVTNGTAILNVSNLLPGVHNITVFYPGDSHYEPCLIFVAYPQTVTKLPTTTTLSVDPSPSACLQEVTLTASVSPNDATGFVEFFDGTTSLGSADVSSGVAVLPTSGLSVATHSLKATYGGSAVYTTSTSSITSHTVVKTTPTVTLTSDINPSIYGQPVTFRAVVSPSSATGSVIFRDSMTVVGTGAVSGGIAQFVRTGMNPGCRTISATYSGDACLNSAVGTVFQCVNRAPSSVSITTNINPSNFGQTVKLTATVLPFGTTGRVTFLSDGNPIGTATVNSLTALATLNVDNLLPVNRVLTVTYPGDIHYEPSASGPYNQVVHKLPSSLTLSSNSNPSVSGEAVDLIATMNQGDATGTVEFFEGATSLGSSDVDAGGVAIVTVPSLSLGIHTLHAVYGGGIVYLGSTSPPYDQEVVPAVQAGLAGSVAALTTGAVAAQAAFGSMDGAPGAPREFALSRLWPNPSPGPLSIAFTVARPAEVRLSVLDLQGREVAVLAQGAYTPGSYRVQWSGRTDKGQVPAGLYFVRYLTPEKKLVSRVTVAR